MDTTALMTLTAPQALVLRASASHAMTIPMVTTATSKDVEAILELARPRPASMESADLATTLSMDTSVTELFVLLIQSVLQDSVMEEFALFAATIPKDSTAKVKAVRVTFNVQVELVRIKDIALLAITISVDSIVKAHSALQIVLVLSDLVLIMSATIAITTLLEDIVLGLNAIIMMVTAIQDHVLTVLALPAITVLQLVADNGAILQDANSIAIANQTLVNMNNANLACIMLQCQDHNALDHSAPIIKTAELRPVLTTCAPLV